MRSSKHTGMMRGKGRDQLSMLVGDVALWICGGDGIVGSYFCAGRLGGVHVTDCSIQLEQAQDCLLSGMLTLKQILSSLCLYLIAKIIDFLL